MASSPSPGGSAESKVLLAATGVALLWANSPWEAAYRALFHTRFAVSAVSALGVTFHLTLADVITHGLMTIFFFSVGMEIKRERVWGELRTNAQAALPLVAAFGGMVVPALLYLAFNPSGPGAAGWGIPIATDIAFAIGLLTALEGRVPASLAVFLLALAVFDDIGGILVIALFYGEPVHLQTLFGAVGLAAATLVVGRAGIQSGVVYLMLGGLLWWAFHLAGIHATLAGVVLGFAVSTRAVGAGAADREPPLTRFHRMVQPLVSFAIVPLFALCSAGIGIGDVTLPNVASPIFLGIFFGLVIGKPVGILLATWLAHRTARMPYPASSTPGQLAGIGLVAGIGFTVSLFIAELAFARAPLALAQAKMAVLLGSATSAILGFLWLRLASRPDARAIAATAHP